MPCMQSETYTWRGEKLLKHVQTTPEIGIFYDKSLEIDVDGIRVPAQAKPRQRLSQGLTLEVAPVISRDRGVDRKARIGLRLSSSAFPHQFSTPLRCRWTLFLSSTLCNTHTSSCVHTRGYVALCVADRDSLRLAAVCLHAPPGSLSLGRARFPAVLPFLLASRVGAPRRNRDFGMTNPFSRPSQAGAATQTSARRETTEICIPRRR